MGKRERGSAGRDSSPFLPVPFLHAQACQQGSPLPASGLAHPLSSNRVISSPLGTRRRRPCPRRCAVAGTARLMVKGAAHGPGLLAWPLVRAFSLAATRLLFRPLLSASTERPKGLLTTRLPPGLGPSTGFLSPGSQNCQALWAAARRLSTSASSHTSLCLTDPPAFRILRYIKAFSLPGALQPALISSRNTGFQTLF